VTLGLAIALATISIGAQRAQAGFQVCNETNFKISVAIGYVSQQQTWIAEGWWPIEGGKCHEILKGDLTNRYYYFYANGRDGDKMRRWSGDTSFCIQMEKFTLDQAQYGKNTEEDCTKAGLRFAKFRKVDVRGQKSHTHRLKLHDAPEAASNQPGAGAPGPGLAPQLQPNVPQMQPAGPQMQPPAPQYQRPSIAGGGNTQPRSYQPPPQAPQRAPQAAPSQAPQAAPGTGGAGTACQRYPNLC
jgi:uncharacterized membrane protein